MRSTASRRPPPPASHHLSQSRRQRTGRHHRRGHRQGHHSNGSSCREPSVSFTVLTQPSNGTLTGTAPNLIYTPNPGYTGPDHFTFRTADTLTTSEPATVGIVVGTAGTGLKGEYFDNANFTNPVLTRTDAQVNFDWGTGSPHASINADTFSVRWSGLLLVPETCAYTFSALSNDGVRLYINGVPVIDNFVDQNSKWNGLRAHPTDQGPDGGNPDGVL